MPWDGSAEVVVFKSVKEAVWNAEVTTFHFHFHALIHEEINKHSNACSNIPPRVCPNCAIA
jgi:hypothetical protein